MCSLGVGKVIRKRCMYDRDCRGFDEYRLWFVGAHINFALVKLLCVALCTAAEVKQLWGTSQGVAAWSIFVLSSGVVL